MNKIEKLLNEFCPDGVEFKDLGDVLDYEQPWKYLVDSTNYDNSYKTPVLTAWQTFILWYTDEEDWIYQASKENPVIIFDDFTTAFKWVDFSFKAKSSAMKMLTSKNIKEYNLRYVFFAMSCLTYSPQDHARQWIQTYSKIQIPIPPIEIQKEIVKILDTFTLLEAELEAELEARKKQYEYYRDDLLSFGDDEVEWKTLDDVCLSINAGWDLPEKYLKGQKEPSELFPYPIYSNWTDESALYGFTDSYKIDKEAITISARWTIGYHTVREPNFTPIVRLITCIPYNEIISTKFLNYILDKTEIWHSWWSIPQLTTPNVKKLQIPVPYKNWKPDLEKQQEIVAILDKFDALVNDISVWLPAELKARRQQYEYYRNKLLDFKVLEN